MRPEASKARYLTLHSVWMTSNPEVIHSHERTLLGTSASHNCCALSPRARKCCLSEITLAARRPMFLRTCPKTFLAAKLQMLDPARMPGALPCCPESGVLGRVAAFCKASDSGPRAPPGAMKGQRPVNECNRDLTPPTATETYLVSFDQSSRLLA
jgi:hypothetical protein